MERSTRWPSARSKCLHEKLIIIKTALQILNINIANDHNNGNDDKDKDITNNCNKNDKKKTVRVLCVLFLRSLACSLSAKAILSLIFFSKVCTRVYCFDSIFVVVLILCLFRFHLLMAGVLSFGNDAS